MGRNRVHESAAERQKAYRHRVAENQGRRRAPKPRRPRQPSRPARLAAVQRTIEELKQDYEGWLHSLPESLQDGDQASRATETIEQLEAILDLLSDVRPPLGFGRD